MKNELVLITANPKTSQKNLNFTIAYAISEKDCKASFLKGNTYCHNFILRAFKVMFLFRNRASSESNFLSHMLHAISLNVIVKKNSTKPVDPSNFLWALKWETSNVRGATFDFNFQQNVTEILQTVLDGLKGVLLQQEI